ncbi:MAG: hypothetical protein U0R44_05275 [Candidatus Micrarchaeia archaeon]
MTSQKTKPVQLQEAPDLRRSPSNRVIPALLGKRAVFVTDERDMGYEKVVMPHVLSDCGAHQSSGVISYPEFFSGPPKADILILRSSRVFGLRTAALVESLERFRKENPGSALIVSAFESMVLDRLAPLAESGCIDHLTSRPPDDRELLRLGAGIHSKLQSL